MVHKVAGIDIRRKGDFQTAVAKVSRLDMSKLSALLLLLILLSSGTVPTLAHSRYNVVMVIFDDLRPVLGVYGDALAHTPHLDAFAQGSTVFTRAYSQVS